VALAIEGTLTEVAGSGDRRTWRVYLALLTLLLTFRSVVLAVSEYVGEVVGIADGDTFTLLVDREQLRIRLAEIDAPEKRQPYGNRARQTLSTLIYGKTVRVVEIDRDRCGRVVGRVYVGSIDVNAEMVRRGAAWVYRRYAKDPSLYELENEARAARRGIWRCRRLSENRRGSGESSAANRISLRRQPHWRPLDWLSATGEAQSTIAPIARLTVRSHRRTA
jgi:endonuclease YncB( thermonuclease family)